MLVILFSGINLVFTLVMLALFGWALYGLSASSDRPIAKAFAKAAPGLLTSIGIFGTFFGIVLALLDFSSANIREHIDNIINGMQTAFITSVEGVFLSLVIKAITIYQEARKSVQEGNADNENSQDLIARFIRQGEHTEKLTAQMEALLRAIGSDSENSMLGQIRLMRADISDGHKIRVNQFHHFEKELSSKLDTFADMLSRSATEQIIDALRQVIADFNHKISEQFGENFKQLNHAVGKLLEWQENYKQQLAEMDEQYKHGVSAITYTGKAVQGIQQSTETIPQHMEKLVEVVQSNQQQINRLKEHLQAFADLRDKAVAALPEVQKHIVKLGGAVSSAAQEFNIQTKASFEALGQTAKHLQENGNQIRNHATEINNELNKAAIKFVENVSDGQKRFEDANTRILQGMSEKAEEALSRTGESLQKQVSAMDKAMSQEVQRVTQQMGNALVTITGTFTQDYKKLVDEMNRIVRYGKSGGR